MKTTILILFLALGGTARAQMQYVDTTTVTTNGSGYRVVGDNLATAFGKLNSDLALISAAITNADNLATSINSSIGASNTWFAAWIAGVNTGIINLSNSIYSGLFVTNGGSGYTLGGTFAGTFSGNGRTLFISGTNLDAWSVNSNAFDFATMTWLNGLTSGYILSGATMNFDSGAITSDGSGNITAGSFFGPLRDQDYQLGSAGQFPMASGAGTWLWTSWPATLSYDSGTITSDGSGNLTAGSYFGSLKDSGYSTGAATYVPVANGDGTWTWAAPSGGSGGLMNFDGGLIVSDGGGNITANALNSNSGQPVGINNFGDTGGETDPSQILLGSLSGNPGWVILQGQGKISFYSGSGSYLHENYGIHLVCALGQQDNHPNWSDGPMVIGYDYASSLPGTYFPDNSLSVEGYAGFGNYSPAYPVDVTGDINLSGVLRMNGNAVIQNDSSGNGGTTLMLNAQDNGTPMYIHVTSAGVITATSSL